MPSSSSPSARHKNLDGNISETKRATRDPLVSKRPKFWELFRFSKNWFFGFLDFCIFWIFSHISGTKRTTGDPLVSKQPDFRGLFRFLGGSHGLITQRARRKSQDFEMPVYRYIFCVRTGRYYLNGSATSGALCSTAVYCNCDDTCLKSGIIKMCKSWVGPWLVTFACTFA